jgi:hypothetical protein
MNYQNSNQFENIERLYWSISKTAIRAVLDRIRTTLVELVAEMRAGMPEDVDIPNAELASQAVNVTVHGKGHRVTVTTVQSGADGSGQAREPTEEGEARNWKRWAKIGGFIVGLATVIAPLITSAQFVSKPAGPQRCHDKPQVIDSGGGACRLLALDASR